MASPIDLVVRSSEIGVSLSEKVHILLHQLVMWDGFDKNVFLKHESCRQVWRVSHICDFSKMIYIFTLFWWPSTQLGEGKELWSVLWRWRWVTKKQDPCSHWWINRECIGILSEMLLLSLSEAIDVGEGEYIMADQEATIQKIRNIYPINTLYLGGVTIKE